MAALVFQSSERVLDHTREFIRCARGGVVHRSGLMGNGSGRTTLEAGFHHTAFVVADGFGPVLVRDVNFHAGDVRGEMPQSVFHHGADVSAQGFPAFDAAAGVYLNLHRKSGLGISRSSGWPKTSNVLDRPPGSTGAMSAPPEGSTENRKTGASWSILE